MMPAIHPLYIPTWHFLSPSSSGADPSPSHHVVNSFIHFAVLRFRMTLSKGVAFSFGRTNLEDSGLLIVKRRACAP
jgi:hypothetical protein